MVLRLKSDFRENVRCCKSQNQRCKSLQPSCKILALVRSRYSIKRGCQFHGRPYTLKDLFCRLVYQTVCGLLNAFIVLYAGGTNIKTIIISNVHLLILMLFRRLSGRVRRNFVLFYFFRGDRVMDDAMVDDKIAVLSIASREPRA